jgi:hypothetical protein
MNNQHPITPPPELVQQWHDECHKVHEPFLVHIANQAARWGADQQLKLDAEQIAQAYQAGADQELQSCCEWLEKHVLGPNSIERLRAARRPKPPSLKEQALAALREAESTGCLYVNGRSDLIRRALEALPE